MTISSSGLTISVAGTYRIMRLHAATESKDPFQQLAGSFLSGTSDSPDETLAEAQSTSMTSTGNQSDSLMASAVGQTLGQFGVNIDSYSLPDAAKVSQATYDAALTQRFNIVQFVGTLFQTLGAVATNADSMSTSQAQSTYVQALNALASAVQDGTNGNSTESGQSTVSKTELDDLSSSYGSIAKDLSSGQTLADFLKSLASNLSGVTPDAPAGVFVQTSA